jgi:hypothetical protein
MKSNGVFLGGLTSVLACNLMLIGVCSSGPVAPAPASVPPPPAPPPPIVRIVVKPAEIPTEPVPLGLFFWGCGPHLSADPEGVLALPICAPLRL